MNLRDVYRMDEKEYKVYLIKYVDDVWESIVEATSIECGHAKSEHSGKTDEQMLGRCIMKNVNVSQFVSYTMDGLDFTVNGFLADTLQMRAGEIADWICDRSRKEMLELSENYGEVVGYGFEKGTGLKKDTPQIGIILRKTRYPISQFGFFVEMAYPQLDHENARYVAQLSRDPYKDGIVLHGTLDDITVLRSKEDVLREWELSRAENAPGHRELRQGDNAGDADKKTDEPEL